MPQNAPTDPFHSSSSVAVLPTTSALPDDMQIAASPTRKNCTGRTCEFGTQMRSFAVSSLSPILPARSMGTLPSSGKTDTSALSKVTPRMNSQTSPSLTQRQPDGSSLCWGNECVALACAVSLIRRISLPCFHSCRSSLASIPCGQSDILDFALGPGAEIDHFPDTKKMAFGVRSRVPVKPHAANILVLVSMSRLRGLPAP